jgi:hypothetical protein
MLKGLLLKESLNDTQVLEILTLTKTETWNVENPADYQPAVWTAVSFEADERQADVIAEQLSRALKPAWFINASSVAYVYVIFPGKVFKYHKGDRAARATAYQHGLSIGIPARQLDWSE